jgi:hypothetical protein
MPHQGRQEHHEAESTGDVPRHQSDTRNSGFFAHRALWNFAKMTQETTQPVETETVRSFYWSNQEILDAIQKLHCPEGFECDMTYGNGSFWKERKRPKYCFDITPLHDGVIEADSQMLPLEPSTLDNAVVDPPFLTYVKAGREHKDGKVAMTARFGGYYAYSELEDHYRGTISEAYRVLKPGGKLIFKCQDVIHNHRMHATHVNVCNWAEYEGFRLLDLFILPAKSRMPGPQKGIQRHARVFHSYFLVFLKK